MSSPTASLFALNESAAQAFTDIGSYLQLKGENPFKIKAYFKASRVLRELEDDLEELCAKGELRSIAGVGKAIADKLEAFINTGSIPQLEALKEEIPSGLVEMSALPGLGAKKTIQLHKELGVSDLEQLQAALREGKVESLKGFSKKSQEKILAAVDKALTSVKTFLKSRLEEWAAQTLERLQDVSGLDSAEAVGGVRRLAPEGESLELLLLCSNLEAARQDVESRLKEGGTAVVAFPRRLEFEHPSGCPVKLHFCAGEGAAMAFLRHTGPAEFLEHLQVSGVDLEGAAASEEAIFESAKLPFVLPELRHQKEPFVLAQRELPSLQLMKGNLHAHTTASDGTFDLREMVEASRGQGHQFFGVTDHSRSLVIANGLTEERLLAQIEEVRKLDAELSDFKVFAGNETDILEDGRLDYADEILDQLDYSVAAVHSFFHLSKEKMTERLLKGLDHPKVRVFAHPTGRLLTRRDGYQADWEAVFRLCSDRNIAVEINASPWRLDISEELLGLALSLNCLIAVNTDAHSIEEMDYVRHGVDMARRGAVAPAVLVNTWTATVVEDWFRTGKRPD